MYKGYEVHEEVIRDYEFPETAFVLCAPCGCTACEDSVQPGHFACSTTPSELRDDENVFPRLEGNRWFFEYFGPLDAVDSFLEQGVAAQQGVRPTPLALRLARLTARHAARLMFNG